MDNPFYKNIIETFYLVTSVIGIVNTLYLTAYRA